MNLIHTERLILKPTTTDDADLYFELMNTPEWLEYIGDLNVRTVGDARNYIKSRVLPQIEKLGYGSFTITRKSDNVKIGTCGLYNLEGMEGIDIGFALLPEFEQKGYAFEAVDELWIVLKVAYQIDKIKAITTKENKSSQKLLVKLGLKFRKFIKLPGDDKELMLFE